MQIENPLVSIIVPVFNADNYLNRLIDSIKAQTNANWELIFIDDCSSDLSREIIQKQSDSDCRIKHIFLDQNGGPARARNCGIEASQGEYIAFADADDYVSADFVEKMTATAIYYNADIIWCQFFEVMEGVTTLKDNGLSTREKFTRDEALRLFYKQTVGLGSVWNKVYRKSFIMNNNIRMNENRVRAEDWEFNLNAFKQLGTLKIISDSLYYYVRENSHSVMSSFRENDFELMCASSKILSDINSEYNLGIEEGYDVNTNAIFFIEYLFRASRQDTLYANKVIGKVLANETFNMTLKKCDSSSLSLTYKLIRLVAKTRKASIVKSFCRLLLLH